MVSDGYYTTDIKKTKDLHSCTGRDSFKTMLQMTPYKVPSVSDLFTSTIDGIGTMIFFNSSADVF